MESMVRADPTTTASTRALFDELARGMEGDGVFVGVSFGRRALKAPDRRKNSLGFVCLGDEDVAFRLPAGTPEHDEALAVEGAHIFAPSSLVEGLDDWVAVPAVSASRWPRWARAALKASAA